MLPADSEHSAIFQTLQGVPPGALKKIILTASGGAFRDWPKEKLAEVKVAGNYREPYIIVLNSRCFNSRTNLSTALRCPETPKLGNGGQDYS